MKTLLLSRFIVILTAVMLISSCGDNKSSGNTKLRPNKTIWLYGAYADSTINDKSIFKYSQGCASWSYMIKYDPANPDSIFFSGYHENSMLPLVKKEDSTYHAGSGENLWELKYSDYSGELRLKKYRGNAQNADPRTYVFDDRKEGVDYPAGYFNDKLFAGVYRDGEKIIRFHPDFTVEGMRNVYSYKILTDFREKVPQMDMIYLSDSLGQPAGEYHWSFHGAELILQNAKAREENGNFVDAEATDTAFTFLLVTQNN